MHLPKDPKEAKFGTTLEQLFAGYKKCPVAQNVFLSQRESFKLLCLPYSVLLGELGLVLPWWLENIDVGVWEGVHLEAQQTLRKAAGSSLRYTYTYMYVVHYTFYIVYSVHYGLGSGLSLYLHVHLNLTVKSHVHVRFTFT